MKEMVYGPREIEVLHKETYLGFDFYVVSLGTHPCIYVAIPEGYPWHGLEYTDETIDITPHCGFTFSGVLDVCDNKWCLGWDYAHCDDFYYPVWQAGKKWSTSELIEEAHKTIEQFPGNRGTLYVAGQQLRRAWIDFVGEVKKIWWDVVFCVVMIVAVVALLVSCAWHRELALTICNIFNLITWIMNLFFLYSFSSSERRLKMSKILKYSTELGEDGAAYSKELCPYGQTAGDRNVVMGLGSHSCSKCRFCEERDPFKKFVKCRFEVLDLSLTFQWYDMIASGEKKEEYRKRNDFYWHRFHACNNQCPPGFDVGMCKVCPRTFLKHYDAVRFHRGQGSPETMLVAVDGIRIGYGREDWGAPKGEQVYIIQLGDRLV